MVEENPALEAIERWREHGGSKKTEMRYGDIRGQSEGVQGEDMKMR